jgi:hypothetical protein
MDRAIRPVQVGNIGGHIMSNNTISTGAAVILSTGRKTTVSPRTCNTVTGFVAWLTQGEAKRLKLDGYSTGRYSYSVDMSGQVERWINGYGGYVATVAAPVVA